jgi:hypothetical protein
MEQNEKHVGESESGVVLFQETKGAFIIKGNNINPPLYLNTQTSFRFK